VGVGVRGLKTDSIISVSGETEETMHNGVEPNLKNPKSVPNRELNAEKHEVENKTALHLITNWERGVWRKYSVTLGETIGGTNRGVR